MTTDGKLYKPEKYKAIIKDEIYICKNTSATHADVESMTPFERDLWITEIDKQNRDLKDSIEKSKGGK